MFANDTLEGRVALITGGGSGIGLEIATAYSRLGAAVMLVGRNEERVAAAAETLRAEGGRAAACRCDVRNYGEVEAAVAATLESFGSLDVLVNNAAGNFIAKTETLSHRAVDSVLNIVLHGTTYVTLAAGRRWIASGHKGTVLSILATYAWTGSPYVVPSAMAKAGVLALMQSLAVEWGGSGIRTVSIAPGPFPTKGAWDRLVPPSMVDAWEKAGPMRRVGEHIELANLASYLVSDMAAYINGDCITIDGGRWLQGASMFHHLSQLSEEQWAAMRPKKG
jgi:NAD(P)-dependent dehydrogenase (short-subunit alcohol dehydrogenase family)